VTGVYWYVSRQKVDALMNAFGPKGFNFKELSLTLKAPLLGEAKASLNPDRSLIRNVESVENGIKSAGAASPLTDAGSQPLFYFRGRAHRAVEHGAYFILLSEAPTAILLAGSPSNAIGAPPKQSDEISPSADPFGSIRRAFKEQSIGELQSSRDLGGDCAYMWATLADVARESWTSMPEVEGFAVFGAVFAAARHFQRMRFPELNRIVVGTPIFVRQI
jgi:hypothetical protein